MTQSIQNTTGADSPRSQVLSLHAPRPMIASCRPPKPASPGLVLRTEHSLRPAARAAYHRQP